MTLDVLGNIGIFRFPDKTKKSGKIKAAKNLLKRRPSIRTVLEKQDKIRGRLRTLKTKYLLGEKNKKAKYKENGCVFIFDVEKCYFSPRLSEERKEIAEKIKKKDRVLVLFAGVNPYGIVIAKKKKVKIVAVELGKECKKYALENARINHVQNYIEFIQGDVKKKVNKKLGKFDVIVMPRPNLKETFLKEAFLASKKGTRIFYYCFGKQKDLNKQLKEINEQAKKSKKKIHILKIKKAGEIAPFKFRWRIDFSVR